MHVVGFHVDDDKAGLVALVLCHLDENGEVVWSIVKEEEREKVLRSKSNIFLTNKVVDLPAQLGSMVCSSQNSSLLLWFGDVNMQLLLYPLMSATLDPFIFALQAKSLEPYISNEIHDKKEKKGRSSPCTFGAWIETDNKFLKMPIFWKFSSLMDIGKSCAFVLCGWHSPHFKGPTLEPHTWFSLTYKSLAHFCHFANSIAIANGRFAQSMPLFLSFYYANTIFRDFAAQLPS